MVQTEGASENPHRISFSNDQLGVNIEVNLNDSAMETLDPVERELLTRLVRAEAYTLAILMKVKGNMPGHEWRNSLRHSINDQREDVFEAEGYLPRLAEFLGLDIEPPPYEQEIRQIPTTESA